MASRMYIFLALVSTALFGFSTALEAGEEALDKNTVIVYSVDDWQQSLSGTKDSDLGRFMEESSVTETIERLTAGFTALMSENFEGTEESKENFQMVWEHLGRMYNEMTGEFVMGIGYRVDPDMPMPMPNLLIDFHGPADFGDEHRKMLGVLQQALEADGQMAIPASFAIGDIEFTGVEMMPGVGIYVGQFEDHHVVSTNKGSLQSYLATGDTAVGERFGSTTIYKAAENSLRRGSSTFYVNLDALWNLTPMLDRVAGGFDPQDDPESGPTPSKIISALGLDAIGGLASKSYQSEAGTGLDSIIAMKGRPGILGLFPEQNGDITWPPVIPAEASSAQIIRLNFSKIFDIGVDIGSTIEGADPEEMRAQMDATLEGMKMATGIDIKEIVNSLEGSLLVFQPAPDPNAPPPNPMAMMMGGGFGDSFAFNFGIKISDRGPWDEAMKKLGGPEMMGPALKTEEFQGREVWSFDPLGDVPPEFAGGGPQFVPAWTFEDDWLLVSMSKDALQEMLRLADDEGGAHLGDSGSSAKILSKVKATQGLSISLQNTGDGLAAVADIMRPLLGILPLLNPEMSQQEGLLFLFDPSNIPESDLFRKYFGWAAARMSVVDDGLKIYQFTETVTEASETGDGSEDAKGAGL
ncbi:MAG: hypothetical protein AAEJ47_04210 [Planctomycetota bacterium]